MDWFILNSIFYLICHCHIKHQKSRTFYCLKQSHPVYLKLVFSGEEKSRTSYRIHDKYASNFSLFLPGPLTSIDEGISRDNMINFYFFHYSF